MRKCFALLVLIVTQAWGQSSGNSPTFRMTGGANLASDFIEQGLTQTENDPNLQGEFWFNFGPQFRLGLWGSNVRYDATASTHFWLRLNADIKIDFGTDANFIIKYSDNKFYKENNRNGSTLALHLNLGSYRVIYEDESNWEGTSEKATYIAIAKDTNVGGDYIWNLQAGYTQPEADIKSYFDVRTGLGKKLKDIFVSGHASYSNVQGDFEDRGRLTFFLSAAVQF